MDPDQEQSDLGPHCLPVCKNMFEKFARIFSGRHKQTTFLNAGFLGVLRVKVLYITLKLLYLNRLCTHVSIVGWSIPVVFILTILEVSGKIIYNKCLLSIMRSKHTTSHQRRYNVVAPTLCVCWGYNKQHIQNNGPFFPVIIVLLSDNDHSLQHPALGSRIPIRAVGTGTSKNKKAWLCCTRIYVSF